MQKANEEDSQVAADPNAPHDYKKINVPFNEYEYRRLEEASSKSGRSKLNFIRWAMLKAAHELT